MKGILLTAVFGILCLTGLLAAPAAGAVRLDIEAEDFDRVPLYPDWHTSSGQGWYAMEQRYFSGYAGLICDAQSVGAETTCTFKEPLPAGRYRFFLYLLKMRSGGKNSLEVAVGDQKWTVTWDENIARVRDYAVVPHDLVLDRPASRITIKSLQIERHNIGDVPSYPIPTIMLDRMVITDDLELQVIESGGRQGVGRPEAESGKPAAAGPALTGNRVANGSFEVGTTTTWFNFGDPLQPANLVEGAAHGRRCLELPQLSSAFQTAGICSGVFRGAAGEKVPVSLYLKSTAPISVSVAVQNTARREAGVLKAAVTDQWQRFNGEAVLPPDPEGAYSLIIRPEVPGKPVRVFVDAVSVGLAAGADYQARSRYEAGLAGTALANIYHDRERAPAVLTLANHDRKAWPADLEILVRDHRDEVVARQPVKAACPAGSGLERTVNLAAGRWGVFSAVVRDRQGGTDLAELCYINLPPVEGRNNFLGFYGSAWNDRNMAIFKELGIDFVATLADGSARHIRTDGFDDLDRVLDTPARRGIGVFYATEILYHKPQKDFQWSPSEGVTAFPNPPNLKSLFDDLYAFAGRFAPKIDSWCLQDELYEGKCPLNAWLLYHKTAVEAIRKADPDAVITVSSEPAFQERVLKLLGPEYLSVVCDPAFSPMTSRRYNHLPFTRLAREYGIPLWFSGFGFPSVSFYRTRAADMRYKNPNYSELVDRTAMVLAANRL
ncbi:MAG TPA: hypothetical protein PKN80_06140, partial [bacterium]|nr:hypothetical protein [bacterium]